MTLKLVSTFAVSLLLISYNKDVNNDPAVSSHNGKLHISEENFNNYPDDPLMILDAFITGDTLTITFGASCCNGNSWIVNLVGDEEVLYSLPPQRELRLSLRNDELCEAFCSKKVKFDITPARLTGTNRVILNLSGWNSNLVYEY